MLNRADPMKANPGRLAGGLMVGVGVVVAILGLIPVASTVLDTFSWSAPETPLIGIGVDDRGRYFAAVGPVGASETTVVEVYADEDDLRDDAAHPLWRIDRPAPHERSDSGQFTLGEPPVGWDGAHLPSGVFGPGNVVIISNGCFFASSEVPTTSLAAGVISLSPGHEVTWQELQGSDGFSRCQGPLLPVESRWLLAFGTVLVGAGTVVLARARRLHAWTG